MLLSRDVKTGRPVRKTDQPRPVFESGPKNSSRPVPRRATLADGPKTSWPTKIIIKNLKNKKKLLFYLKKKGPARSVFGPFSRA